MGKKRKKGKKKEYAIYVGSCIFYSEESAGCKLPVKSMFLQLSKSLFFPEYTGQLSLSQTPRGDKGKNVLEIGQEGAPLGQAAPKYPR